MLGELELKNDDWVKAKETFRGASDATDGKDSYATLSLVRILFTVHAFIVIRFRCITSLSILLKFCKTLTKCIPRGPFFTHICILWLQWKCLLVFWLCFLFLSYTLSLLKHSHLICLFHIGKGNWNYFAAIRNEKRNPKLEATHLEKAKELYTRVWFFCFFFFLLSATLCNVSLVFCIWSIVVPKWSC